MLLFFFFVMQQDSHTGLPDKDSFISVDFPSWQWIEEIKISRIPVEDAEYFLVYPYSLQQVFHLYFMLCLNVFPRFIKPSRKSRFAVNIWYMEFMLLGYFH